MASELVLNLCYKMCRLPIHVLKVGDMYGCNSEGLGIGRPLAPES